MKITQFIEKAFQRFLPSPFAIAVILTVLTLLLALFFTEAPKDENHFLQILSFWEHGIWSQGLLVFAYQMMLILVLGHIMVLSQPMNRLINGLTKWVHDTQSAVVLVSISTLLVAFFNWGLGLIFGAILARKVAEASQSRGFSINYPLVGAAGYVGLMVWHGGISGSAPSKVSEKGHLQNFVATSDDASWATSLPDLIPYSETIFSVSNLLIFAVLLICIPLFLYFLGKKAPSTAINLPVYSSLESDADKGVKKSGIDHSIYIGKAFGIIVLIAFIHQYHTQLKALIITPNMLNFLMLGTGLLLHGSFSNFLKAVEEAIKGTSGILIQFPLYFGIMGIMQDSGMVTQISNFFVSIASETTLPLFTFVSAGLVNIFVPSGGGQWAVQGPIVVESALRLGVPLNKAIMALAYGDQLTNMLQPFWALPLLGITQLKAKQILPYTLLLMVLGAFIFVVGLLLW